MNPVSQSDGTRVRAHSIEPSDVLDCRLAPDREKSHVRSLIEQEPRHVEEVLDALFGTEDSHESHNRAGAGEELASDVGGAVERLEVDEVVDDAHPISGTMGTQRVDGGLGVADDHCGPKQLRVEDVAVQRGTDVDGSGDAAETGGQQHRGTPGHVVRDVHELDSVAAQEPGRRRD